eukprot:456708-Pyramimonas_sp.AAC.1
MHGDAAGASPASAALDEGHVGNDGGSGTVFEISADGFTIAPADGATDYSRRFACPHQPIQQRCPGEWR